MKPNILFVVIDSFREDYLSNEYKIASTKTLDHLISNGTYFANTFSSADGTLRSWASIFTGLFPFRTGVTLSNKHALSENVKNYVKILKENGYHAYASLPDILYLNQLTTEFENDDKIHDYYFELSNGLGDKIIQKLKSKSMKEPWLYFININDLHLPNWPSKEFDNEKFGLSRYERTISQIDFWLGKFLENVDMKKTLIVITADHGEYVPFVSDGDLKVDFEPHKMQKILREVGKKLPTRIRKKIAVSVIAKSERIKHESKIKSLNLRPFHKRQLLFTRSFDHYFVFLDLLSFRESIY